MKAPYLLALTLLLASACTHHEQPLRLQGEAQGTYYNIAYYDPSHRNLQPQVDSILSAFDQTASLWVENSIIRKVNRHEDTEINAVFEELLCRSLHV